MRDLNAALAALMLALLATAPAIAQDGFDGTTRLCVTVAYDTGQMSPSELEEEGRLEEAVRQGWASLGAPTPCALGAEPDPPADAPAAATPEAAVSEFITLLVPAIDDAAAWESDISRAAYRAQAGETADLLLAGLLAATPHDCYRDNAWVEAWLWYANLRHLADAPDRAAERVHTGLLGTLPIADMLTANCLS